MIAASPMMTYLSTSVSVIVAAWIYRFAGALALSALNVTAAQHIVIVIKEKAILKKCKNSTTFYSLVRIYSRQILSTERRTR
jgi:hypothetical protein